MALPFEGPMLSSPNWPGPLGRGNRRCDSSAGGAPSRMRQRHRQGREGGEDGASGGLDCLRRVASRVCPRRMETALAFCPRTGTASVDHVPRYPNPRHVFRAGTEVAASAIAGALAPVLGVEVCCGVSP